jgi:hypothetical protein
MNTAGITDSLHLLLYELTGGAPDTNAFVLNPRDPGLLRSLDRLSAEAASQPATGGASIAAHVDHLRYGLSLMNRWATGENPFRDANWSASWKRSAVTKEEWATLRRQLEHEVERWLAVVATPRDVTADELNSMIGSVVHLAYHLGAMRQIDRTLRGPAATE